MDLYAVFINLTKDFERVTKDLKFFDASHLFDLTISLSKTKVMHQPPRSTTIPSNRNIDGNHLNSVNLFKYEGSVSLFDDTPSMEIEAWTSKAS